MKNEECNRTESLYFSSTERKVIPQFYNVHSYCAEFNALSVRAMDDEPAQMAALFYTACLAMEIDRRLLVNKRGELYFFYRLILVH